MLQQATRSQANQEAATIPIEITPPGSSLQQKFEALVMCNFTPRRPSTLPLARWVSCAHTAARAGDCLHTSAYPLILVCSLPCVRSPAVYPLPPVRSEGCVADGPGQPEADDHRMVQGTPCLCRHQQRRVVQAGQEHRPARRLRPALLLLQVLLRAHTKRNSGSPHSNGSQWPQLTGPGVPSQQQQLLAAGGNKSEKRSKVA